MTIFLRIGLCCIVVAVAGCARTAHEQNEHENTDAGKLFRRVPSSQSNVTFVNALAENDSVNIFTYQYTYNGAGVAAADFNKDGLVDLYFAANFSSGKLYVNAGQLTFNDKTVEAGLETTGWCTGVTVVDINNDGWDDLYICRSGPTSDITLRRNLLYVNNGNGTFTERAAEYGIDDAGHSTQAFFFDADLDGDLDLFVLNHSVTWEFDVQKRDIQNKLYNDFTTPHFYRNDNGRFVDVSQQAGVKSNAFCLGAVIVDVNHDGYPDIYVCNDYVMNDFLYVNQGNGTFRDQIQDYFPHTSYFSMGVDAGDINNDGLVDIYTLDMLPEPNNRQKMNNGFFEYDRYMIGVKYGYGYQFMHNNLQLNNGNGSFSDIGDMAGVARTDWSWAPLFGDLDNDGWKDLVVTNGYRRDFTNLDFVTYSSAGAGVNLNDRARMREMIEKIPSHRIPNYGYRNNGDLTFADMGNGWGLNDSAFSQGMVLVDLDNDGDLDVVMSNLDDEAFVYENLTKQKAPAAHLAIRLDTDLPHRGTGSMVKVVHGNLMQVLDCQPTRGYLSSANVPLHFGLGQSQKADSVIVFWNDGYYQVLTDVPANQTVTIRQERTVQKKYNPLPAAPTLMAARDGLFAPAYTNVDNDGFIDYKREPLLTRKYSKDGPRMAVADVNGDGLDDIFIGGAKDQSGVLYLQTAGGKFIKSTQPVFEKDNGREDMGCVFFDADGDGDFDLYVVSGSNEIDAPSDYYNDRLYLNDGKGKFSRAPDGSIPLTDHSGSCIVAADFDGDGDIDLFRGGRIYAGKFPMPVRSYVLLNDGSGKFTDATATVCPELQYPGMVTDAAWVDFNSDGAMDLVVVGEWMPVRFFSNQNNKLLAAHNLLDDSRTSGCWQSVLPIDLDGDGDMDFVLGNVGRNTRINATPDKPAVLYYGDFDRNGSVDPILTCYYSDGVRYPYFGRDNYIDQMRFLRKRFNTYAEFSNQTFETMFTPGERSDAKALLCERNESVWLRNDNGRFTLIPLPNAAQMFPVYAAVPFDVDGDGKFEVLLTGNCFHTEVNTGRMDAGRGSVLRYNAATNTLEAIPVYTSGFDTPHDAKSMALVRTATGRLVVVGNNNGPLQVFGPRNSQIPRLAAR